MFAGETIAIGTSLMIGMMIAAQPELYVPITPTRFSVSAYVRAFSEHFASSHFPAAAVASSKASNSTL